MNSNSYITVTIIAKNAASTIGATLDSVKEFNQVILLIDEDSNDETENISLKYANAKIFRNSFYGFGEMKQNAVSYSTNEWIFSLDADEVLSNELIEHIKSLELDPNTVYAIKRNNCYKGRHIEACGWDNDYPIRLFNKNKTNFNHKKVHEHIVTDGMNIVKISQPIIHYSYENENQLREKALRYAKLYKEQHQKHLLLLIVYIKTGARFLRDFIFRRGFLYGKVGYIISKYNALGVYWKYGSRKL